MQFSTAIVALLASVVAAKQIIPSDGIPADSKAANRLLSKATMVAPARQLANNNNNDVSFITNYDIKYLGCSTLVQLNAAGDNGDDQSLLYNQHLVRFALCPANSCGSCSGGGEYVVNMVDFVDAYTEAKLTQQEYDCEMAREKCQNYSCQYANDDDACENTCMANAGMSQCIQYDGDANFEVQEYLECRQVDGNNNNNNNNNNQNGYNNNQQNNGGNYYGSLYVGPYCASDSKSIYLGVFYDQSCTSKAATSLYSSRNNGASLPFSTESMVKSECISCTQQNNNGGGDDNNQYAEPSEYCTTAYQASVKCEKNMNIQYPDTSGCDFVKNVLPRLSSASKSVITGSTGNAARVWAWLFAISTIAFGAYAYFLYRKIKRAGVSLTSQDGSLA